MNFTIKGMFGVVCNVIEEEDLNLLNLLKITKHHIIMEWKDAKIDYSYANKMEIVKVESEIIEIMPCLRMNPYSGVIILKIDTEQLILVLDYCSVGDTITTIKDLADCIKNTFNDGGELIIQLENQII